MKEEIKTKITAYSALIIFHAIILILFFTIGNEKTDYEDERPYNIIPVDSVKITNGNLDLHIEIVKQLSSIILGSEQISPVLVERGKKEIDFIVSNIKLPETANFELIKRYVNLILQEQAEYSIIKDWHNNDDKEVFSFSVEIKSFAFAFSYYVEKDVIMIRHYLFPKKTKYRKFDEIVLIKEQNGINGSLYIYIDNIIPDNITSVLEIPDTIKTRPENAILLMVNDSNQIVRKDTLKRCLAWFDEDYLLKEEPSWIALTIDYSFVLGSYTGPITSFIKVVGSELEWMTAINKTTNKKDTVFLMKSLKTDWEISKSNGTTIFKKACRPNFESSNNDFMIIYSCYYLDGNQWKIESFKEEGFWESSVNDSNYIEKEFYSKYTY